MTQRSLVACFLALFQPGLGQMTTISQRDYQIYSAFLQTQEDLKKAGNHIVAGERGSVIAPTTLTFKRPLPGKERIWIKREMKGIGDATLDAFDSCSKSSSLVQHKFDVSQNYEIAAVAEVGKAQALYAAHPKTWGYIEFSCVGMNQSQSQALFFVERLMCRCAVGEYVFMLKGTDGRWKLKGELVTWIA